MTHATLTAILDIAGKIDAVVRSKNTITLENAFNHPDVLALRDSLLVLLGAESTVEGLNDAVEALADEFDHLHALPRSDENIVKLGIIAGAARSLSIQAERTAGEPQEIFRYTMQVIWPYLESLVKAGIVVAGLVA